MQGYNVIVVLDEKEKKLLMCKRTKNPYKDLLNFVGGKIEPKENGFNAAYRELKEESGITNEDITLIHIMDFTYHIQDLYLEVYVGILNKSLTVIGDENELLWTDINDNFFDMTKYAGEGNIGHIMEHVKMIMEVSI